MAEDLTPEASAIVARYETLPRNLQNSFNSYKTRAKKGRDEELAESELLLEAWDRFVSSPGYQAYLTEKQAEAVPAAPSIEPAEPEGKLLILRAGAASAASFEEAEEGPEAVVEQPAAVQAAVEPAPVAEAQPPVQRAPAPVAEPQRQEGRFVHFLKALEHVHSVRYGIFKLICAMVLIPASAQAVVSFFNGLDLYGSEQVNKILAYVLTAAVDLIAIDMFTRAVQEARSGFWRSRVMIPLIGSVIVIGGNILMASMNMRNSANIESTQASVSDWQKRMDDKEADLKSAQADLAKAKGVFLSLKWPGASDPVACEAGTVKCRGPFVTSNPGIGPAQAELVAKQDAVTTAETAIEDWKAEKPLAMTSQTSVVTEGVLNQREVFYCVLWALIILASLAAPAPTRNPAS